MSQDPPVTSPPALSRRRLLHAGGLGAAFLAGAGVSGGLAAVLRQRSTDAPALGASPEHHHGDELADLGVVRDGYGHSPAPPRDLDEATIAALTFPPERDEQPPGTTRDYELPVTAQRHAIAEGAAVHAWTYAERLPGPLLRATAGDRLRLHVANRTAGPHNLHLHGAHDPQHDGWEPIPAGQEGSYELEAGPVGLHPYHCHVHPIGEHVHRGMYGALVVDPPGGRPPALEVVLVLGGFDLDGDGRNELYAFNGICGLYDRHPIRVPVGELVRVYLVNMIEDDPVASFHLHAQTFDVYRSGTSLDADEHTDQLTLAQADRAVIEFRLPTRGRYMFHPHQHRMAERGAMGWFTAV